ncbi:hypothetical protein SO694_00026381 [Aureococcus anophagefferens]|uniref:Uncharacterized protein n=1 Tax=Aureococcus anophagefferens TaxID=44056 RepID=A0ABR1FUN7_AURAN
MASQNREFLELVHGLMEDRRAGGDGLAAVRVRRLDDAADQSSGRRVGAVAVRARRLRVVQAVRRKAVRCACVGAARLDWLVGRHLRPASGVAAASVAPRTSRSARPRAQPGAAARRVVARRANRAVGAAFFAPGARASSAPRRAGVAPPARARAALDLGASYYLGEAQERRERDDDDGPQQPGGTRRAAATTASDAAAEDARDPRAAASCRRDDSREILTRNVTDAFGRRAHRLGRAAALAEELTAVSRDWAARRGRSRSRAGRSACSRAGCRGPSRARGAGGCTRTGGAAAAARCRWARRARLGRALRAWRRGACFAAAAADAARSRAAALSRHLRKCLALGRAAAARGARAARRALLARGAPRVALDAADAAALEAALGALDRGARLLDRGAWHRVASRRSRALRRAWAAWAPARRGGRGVVAAWALERWRLARLRRAWRAWAAAPRARGARRRLAVAAPAPPGGAGSTSSDGPGSGRPRRGTARATPRRGTARPRRRRDTGPRGAGRGARALERGRLARACGAGPRSPRRRARASASTKPRGSRPTAGGATRRRGDGARCARAGRRDRARLALRRWVRAARSEDLLDRDVAAATAVARRCAVAWSRARARARLRRWVARLRARGAAAGASSRAGAAGARRWRSTAGARTRAAPPRAGRWALRCARARAWSRRWVAASLGLAVDAWKASARRARRRDRGARGVARLAARRGAARARASALAALPAWADAAAWERSLAELRRRTTRATRRWLGRWLRRETAAAWATWRARARAVPTPRRPGPRDRRVARARAAPQVADLLPRPGLPRLGRGDAAAPAARLGVVVRAPPVVAQRKGRLRDQRARAFEAKRSRPKLTWLETFVCGHARRSAALARLVSADAPAAARALQRLAPPRAFFAWRAAARAPRGPRPPTASARMMERSLKVAARQADQFCKREALAEAPGGLVDVSAASRQEASPGGLVDLSAASRQEASPGGLVDVSAASREIAGAPKVAPRRASLAATLFATFAPAAPPTSPTTDGEGGFAQTSPTTDGEGGFDSEDPESSSESDAGSDAAPDGIVRVAMADGGCGYLITALPPRGRLFRDPACTGEIFVEGFAGQIIYFRLDDPGDDDGSPCAFTYKMMSEDGEFSEDLVAEIRAPPL